MTRKTQHGDHNTCTQTHHYANGTLFLCSSASWETIQNSCFTMRVHRKPLKGSRTDSARSQPLSRNATRLSKFRTATCCPSERQTASPSERLGKTAFAGLNEGFRLIQTRRCSSTLRSTMLVCRILMNKQTFKQII